METKLIKLPLYALKYMCVMLFCLSCVDQKYNLDDDYFNKDITIGGDYFAMPVGSSEKLYLDDMLDISENSGVMVNNEGNFYEFSYKNSIDPIIIDLEPISVSPRSNSNTIHFNSPTNISTNLGSYNYTLEVEKCSVEINFETVMPKELLSIDSINFKDVAYLSLSANFDDNIITSVDYSNLEVILPNKLKTALGTNRVKLNANGECLVPINGFDVGFDIVDKELNFSLLFEAEGSINVVASTSSSSYDMNFTADFMGAELDEISGSFKPIFGPILNSFNIELPDFMTFKDNYIDIEGTKLSFNSYSNLPMGIKSVLNFTSYNDNMKSQTLLSTLTIDKSKDGTYKNTEQDIHESDDKNISVSDLIANAPNKIKVGINSSDFIDDCTVKLGEVYGAMLDFSLYIPFKIGSKMLINFPLDDLDIDCSDFGKGVESLYIKMVAVNSVPLDIELMAHPKDENYQIVEGLEVSVSGLIKGGDYNNTSSTETKSNITLTISQKEADSNALSKVRHLGLTVKLTSSSSSETVTLNPDQYMQLTEMKAYIPGGIGGTLDL